jgi:hypothetical protein
LCVIAILTKSVSSQTVILKPVLFMSERKLYLNMSILA